MVYSLSYKIPMINGLPNTGGYHKIMINPRYLNYQEPLVRFCDYGIAGENFYARTDGKNAPYYKKIEGSVETIWGRKTVAEMLTRVNGRLKPFGVELSVWDAYRPVSCQRGLWDYFVEQGRRNKPGASAEELKEYVLNFVSDCSSFDSNDSRTWPVHASGGAVDLTLRDLESKELLDMGVGFDEADEKTYSDAFERKLAAKEIDEKDPRLWNRRLLHWAMTEEGFINYPYEVWHFDYGDQMYVLYAGLMGKPNAPKEAWYGYIESPEGRRGTCEEK